MGDGIWFTHWQLKCIIESKYGKNTSKWEKIIEIYYGKPIVRALVLQQITDIIIFEMWHLSALDITSQKEEICCIRASPPMLSMWPCKNISHIQVLVTNFFPTPPIKLKLWLEVSGRLVIATHLDQSNYLPNQKQGALNKYDLIVFIRLLQVSSRALKTVQLLQGPSTGFCSSTSSNISSGGVGGGHTLNIGGDALTMSTLLIREDPFLDLCLKPKPTTATLQLATPNKANRS
jgi:hypothetical protein